MVNNLKIAYVKYGIALVGEKEKVYGIGEC